MYSTFNIETSDCAMCTNKTLKSLGTLRGVFGAEIDRTGGKIVVSHTDETNRDEIAQLLATMGYTEIINTNEQQNYDEPSEWGCVL